MATPLDKTMLASRHVLTVFFLGLMAGLMLFAARFLYKLFTFATDLFTMSDEDVLLKMLHMLDSALVASLVATVAIASYHSMVSRLAAATESEGVSWVGEVDPGNMKIKLATSIVAISSIHLLTMFMKLGDYSDRDIYMGMLLHGSFLAGVLVLGVLDRLEAKH